MFVHWFKVVYLVKGYLSSGLVGVWVMGAAQKQRGYWLVS